MSVTINEDTTFLVTDELGDIPEGEEFGLYRDDTRFLCRFELRLDGRAPLVLAARATAYHAATHALTNPALESVPRGQVGIQRRRLIGKGLHEDLIVVNHGDDPAAFVLLLRFDADFAHVFDVRRRIEQKPEDARRAPGFARDVAEAGRSLRFRLDRDGVQRRLVVNLSQQPRDVGDGSAFDLEIASGASWHLCIDFLTLRDEDEDEPLYTCRRAPAATGWLHARGDTARMAAFPTLETDSEQLQHAYGRSVEDFEALRIKAEDTSDGISGIAAGIPWFMALFGRDSLIASLQALLFDPSIACDVLRSLASLQGRRVDPVTGEEPGKILHEHRTGRLASMSRTIPAFPYYGSIDSTPLFLVTLCALVRTQQDPRMFDELRESALRALAWLDDYGDRDGDGYLEYIRETDAGLANQGWKDSHDSVRFRDGRIAEPPIALAEVQGYAYAARVGMAGLLEGSGDRVGADAQRERASRLRDAFNRDFWLPERGYFAEALDGRKERVDSLTSNAGQLLWTGIVDDDKAVNLVEALTSPSFFTGWGIRTMARGEGGYNPISYHNGSVWPHDTALIVAGLARYGFTDAGRRVTEGVMATLEYAPDDRLPELFAGYGRDDIPFPVDYPTPSRPQAWASGSVFLLLATMLGFDIERCEFAHEPFLPAGVASVVLRGLQVGGRRTDMRITADRSGRRLQTSPAESTPGTRSTGHRDA